VVTGKVTSSPFRVFLQCFFGRKDLHHPVSAATGIHQVYQIEVAVLQTLPV
jgi:hypothetical protein